jgi:hypothetical protein
MFTYNNVPAGCRAIASRFADGSLISPMLSPFVVSMTVMSE